MSVELQSRSGRIDAVSTALDELEPPYTVINPSVGTIGALCQLEFGGAASESVLVATEDVFKDVRDEYKSAAKLQELVNDGLSVRILEVDPEACLILGEDQHAVVYGTGEDVITTFESEGQEALATIADDAEESFPLRTPGFATVIETASERLGEEFADSFESAISSVESLNTREREADEVALTLALAAKHKLQLYEVSKWGEDIGIASKATFSRTKTRLEDAGLISTEKVPIDIGRPRLRLLLEDPLRDLADEEILGALEEAL